MPRATLHAGCNDPFVHYMFARTRIKQVAGEERGELLSDHLRAALDLAKTDYPAVVKLAAAGSYSQSTRGANGDIAAICMQCLPEVVADRERLPSHVYELVCLAYTAQATVKPARQAFDDVFAVYAKGRPADDPWPHYFKGSLLVDYAWDARGNGLANTVTSEGWELFDQRLTEAAPELARAWEL